MDTDELAEHARLLRRQTARLLKRLDDDLSLRELADACIDATQTGERQRAALGRMALRLLDLEDRIRQQTAGRRRARFEAISERLTQLRRVSSSSTLLDRVCRDIVEVCGFSRAMIGRIDQDQWLPWMVHFSSDPAFEREFVTWLRGTAIPLSDAPPEREALTTRRPVMVRDTTRHGHQPIVMAGRSKSYVVVPLIPAGRVVGFLHADHFPTQRQVDSHDRDALWLFGEDFGRIYERAVLGERLIAQGLRVRAALDLAEVISDSFASKEIALRAPAAPRSQQIAERASTGHRALTRREQEVMRHLVQGMGNRAIAEAMAITEGTVKSHVKQILRKLGATNRTQAIAAYLQIDT